MQSKGVNYMNIKEHLLACLAEECNEVAKDAMKSLRFGVSNLNVLDPTGPTNRERMVYELNDLMGVIALLIEYEVIGEHWVDAGMQKRKKEKVLEFMHYASTVGVLSNSV
jgi:hypothetical protein